MSFYYLATPYSKYPAGIQEAAAEACRQAALLVRAGIPVYSPIAHTHPIAIEGDIDPFDHNIWLEADRTFMEAAKALIVCKMEGWGESYGISVEIEAFHRMGKPVYMMTPGIVPTLKPARQIIGLCGYARSGKDTAAIGLTSQGWTRVSIADGIREALLALDPLTFGNDRPGYVHYDYKRLSHIVSGYSESEGWWDELKKLTDVRQLLQRMGTEAGRNIHGDDCWIKLAKRKIDALPAGMPVVVTDVRFANEAQAIRDWGGKIVRIERPGVGPCNGHASEALDFEADIAIDNFGTIEDLHHAIRSIVRAELDERTDPKDACPIITKPTLPIVESVPLCQRPAESRLLPAACCGAGCAVGQADGGDG